MSATTAQTTDVATVLHDLIKTVPGVRAYAYVADIVRPPAVVIGQPTLDFTDQSAGFCRATWTFPATLVVTRSNERAAQARHVEAAAGRRDRSEGDTPDFVLSVEPLTARPLPGVAVNGQELPAYERQRPDPGLQGGPVMAIKTIKTLTLTLDAASVECQLTRAALVDNPDSEEITTFCGPRPRRSRTTTSSSAASRTTGSPPRCST